MNWFQRFKIHTNGSLRNKLRQVVRYDSYQRRVRLYEELPKVLLLLPTPAQSLENGVLELAPDMDLPLYTMENAAGQEVLPVFTHPEALTQWRSAGCRYFRMRGQGIFQFAARNHFASLVINPADAGVKLTRQEIEYLGTGRIPEVAEDLGLQLFRRAARVMLGSPAQVPPDALLDALRPGLVQFPAIREGYFFQLTDGRGFFRPVVGVQLDSKYPQADGKRMEWELARFCNSFTFGETWIGLMFLHAELLATVSEITPPFYLSRTD